jgi:hypothetical protein
MCFYLLAEVHKLAPSLLVRTLNERIDYDWKFVLFFRRSFTLFHACGLVVMLSDHKYQYLYHHQDQVFKIKIISK